MKKFLCVLLCLTLVFAFCGCGGETVTSSSETSTSTVETSSHVSSETSSVVSSVVSVTSSKTSSTAVTSSEIKKPEKIVTLKDINTKMTNSKDYLITFVGDSITFGHPMSDTEQKFVSIVAKGIAEKFTDRTVIRYDGIENGLRNPLKEYAAPVTVQEGENGKITVVRSGVSGSRMGDTITRAESDFLGTANDRLPKKADIIIIHLGVNDAGDLGTYKRDMRKLVEKIMTAQPETDVVLMTPTSSVSGTLKEYADAMKDLASEKGLAVIDVNGEWLKHYTEGGPNYGMGNYLADQWHPSVIGQKLIADKILSDLFPN